MLGRIGETIYTQRQDGDVSFPAFSYRRQRGVCARHDRARRHLAAGIGVRSGCGGKGDRTGTTRRREESPRDKRSTTATRSDFRTTVMPVFRVHIDGLTGAIRDVAQVTEQRALLGVLDFRVEFSVDQFQ